MSGTRALFASIGASVSLVAAAALSLLAVSAVFAFGGWSTPVAESARQSALVLTTDATPKRAAGAKPVKLPGADARQPRGTRRRAGVRRREAVGARRRRARHESLGHGRAAASPA